MSSNKEFGPTMDFPQQSPASGKPILNLDRESPMTFLDLIDTLASYSGHAGKYLIVNATETGITISTASAIADKNYIHTQSSPATLWTITHNLNKYPAVRIKDGTGHSIEGDIVDVSVNQLTIEFTTAKSGVAIIN